MPTTERLDDAAARRRLFSPARLGTVEVRNRFVKCATYETRAVRGLVTDDLVAWHREFAEGGVGVTTLAYCSVAGEGRTFPDQIVVSDEAVPGLARFADAMHAAGARAAIQLGHAGWFADPHASGTRPLGPSRMFAPKGLTWSRAFTASDFARVRDDFAGAARRAVAAGFDAIEIHVGHGYLLSQFLSPYNNRRDDRYGGSVENRSRFPREVVCSVRAAVGDRAALWIKLNMEDGFGGGLALEDGLEVARLFERDGALDAMQLTGGHTTRSPMFLMRGTTPLARLIANQPTRFRRAVMRVVMPRVIRSYDFEEAFFLPAARRFRAAVGLPLMLLGGVTKLSTMTRAMQDGFDFVALGRALIRRPDLVRQLESGALDASPCVPCNQCMADVGVHPTACPFLEAERQRPAGA
jgi:2,4-dienoyl-CoA reductase-like NADH-dependent reductase (Old Yellow Enzyme family)